MRILCLADAAPDRRLINALRELGHVVEIATEEAALHGAHDLDPQVVIAELHQPSCEWAMKAAAAWPAALQVQITLVSDSSLAAAALRDGADICMARPLEVRELAGRLEADTRRARLFERRGPNHALANRRLKIDGEVFDLTPLENLIVETLSSHPGQILTAEQIGERITRDGEGLSPASVRAAIGRLTARTMQEGGWRLVVRERGLGYRFAPGRGG